MFRAEGVDIDEINFIPHEFSVQPVIDQKAAALSSYFTDEPFALQQMGYRPVVFTPRAAGIDFYGDGLFTTQEQVDKHPHRVEAFRRASLRGWEYALQNEEEIVDLILEKYSQRKTREELLYEAQRTSQLVGANLVPVGYMNPGRWDYIANVFLDAGLIDDPIDSYEFLFKQERPFPWRSFLVSIGALGLFGLIVSLVAWRFYRQNVSLRMEVGRRTVAEWELRESERFFRSVYENAPLPIIYWDDQFRIQKWNSAAEDIFGWTGDEAIGRPFSSFMLPPDDSRKAEDIREEVLKDRGSKAAHWNLRKDGRRIWCQWHNVASMDPEGNFRGCQSIVVDSTIEHLEGEQLVEKTRIAETQNHNKGEFLASVSHEIRNPLSAIISFATILRDDAQSDEQCEIAGLIVDSGNSLIRILSDLIDNEKLELGGLQLVHERSNIGRLTEGCTRLFQPEALKKNIVLKYCPPDDELELTIDGLRYQQVLSNLISNAIKFTSEGSVTVSISLLKEEECPVLLSVEDTGVGMDTEVVERVFRLYDRGGGDREKEFDGSGVGLTVCDNLVRLMGGRIEVKSTPGAGSRFMVRLPLDPTVSHKVG